MREFLVSTGAALVSLLAFNCNAQSTAFTYQGRLQVGAFAAQGNYDLTFALFNAGAGGVQAGSTLSRPNTQVSNGLFTVTLDFGNQFPAVDRWLEIAVRTNGGPAFNTLVPRQQITATPFAIRAANLTGTVSLGQLPPGVLTNNATAVTLSGTFSGSGSGFTNVPLTALGGGGIFSRITSTSLNSQLTYPTAGLSPSSAAVGDLNGDGRADLAVANSGSGTVTVLTNTGTGFALAATITARAGAGSVLLADITRDGRPDVLCVNSDHSIAVARALGNASFSAATFHAATPTLSRLAVGDLNGDGWPEIVAGARDTNVVSIFFNNLGNFPANPSSLFTTARNPYSVAIADLTGDSRPDLVTAHGLASASETNVVVYPGNGTGGFAAPITIPSGNGPKVLAIKDINRDGLKDIVVGMGQSAARIDIFTNSGPGNFDLSQSIGTSYITSMATGDFNGDGWPDVAVTDAGFFSYSGMRMMLSDGAGRVAPGFHLTPFAYPSATAGDLDGDGQSELVVPNGADPGSVILIRFLRTPEMVVSGSTILRGPVTVEEPASFTDTLSFGSTTRQMLNLWGTSYGFGVQSGTLYARSDDAFAWYEDGVHSDAALNPGAGGTRLMTLNRSSLNIAGSAGIGTFTPQTALHVYSSATPTTIRVQSAAQPGAGRVEFLSDPQGSGSEWRPAYIQSTDNGGFTGGLAFVVNGTGFANRFAEIETMRVVNGRVGIGTTTPATALQVVGTVTATAFNPPSDRNLKENFAPVNAREVLEKVAALPISRWNFKGEADTAHVGPMAQDFHAAFSVGTDERHIATVDADGVALAAIQGLNEKLEQQRAENAELKRELAELKRIVQQLAR